mgnify:FL=1
MNNIFDLEFSSDEENYDPYDDSLLWKRCIYGYKYNPNTRWCCNTCWIQQRINKEEEIKKKKEFIYNNIYEECCKEQKNNINFPLIEYYNILKLIPPKNKEEIKKAYYKLALINHPDKNNNTLLSIKKFQEINDAYERLIIVV